MRRRDKREQTIHEAKKVARAAIRLKHTILAERELNEKLPEIVKAIDEAYANGQEYTLDIPGLYELEG